MAVDQSTGRVYYNLDYSHEEIEELFDKIHDGYVLSKEQYDKVIEVLNMEVSEFSGNYEDLKNLPTIPQMMSELQNDVHFQTAEEVNQKLVVLKNNIMAEMEVIEGPQGPQGEQGPKGEDGVFNMEAIYEVLSTEDKTITGAINELFAMIQSLIPEEPVIVNKIFFGHIPYSEEVGAIEYSDITMDIMKNHGVIQEVDVAVMDKTSLGLMPDGAMVVIAVPEESGFVVTKDNGFGSKMQFDEDILGVNGIVVDFNGVNYKIFGELLLADAELFFYVD